MNTEWLRRTAYTVCILLFGLVLAYLAVKYLVFVMLPFLIAWAVAFAMRPISYSVSERLHVKPKIIRPILTVLAAVLLLLFSGVAVWQIAIEVWQILTEFGEGEEFKGFIESFFSEGGILERIFAQFGTSFTDVVYNAVSSLLSSLFRILSSLVSSVPKVFLFVLVTLISTLYFAIDLEGINEAVINILPKAWAEALRSFKDGFLTASLKYARSYLLIFLLTFSLMIVGLVILRIPYALLLALIISFLDLLPIIGVGTFLIPFGVFELMMGNTYQGAGLLALFVIQAVLREFAEPKILGKSLGVHPIITLVILYVGYSFFGITGILLVPVFTVFAEIIFGKKNSADVKKREVSE